MDGDPGEAGFLGDPVEPVKDLVRSGRVAVGPAEDEPGERVVGILAGSGC
ncbi:hypothetical protein ACFWBN_12000 [Streptomyces sp. NPDC059989]